MGSRDHSCPACGRGGMNDPTDTEIKRLKAEVARLTQDHDRIEHDRDNRLCPQCGPSCDLDEDGCCQQCGATAVGAGATRCMIEIRSLRRERDQARADLAGANRVVEAAKAWRSVQGDVTGAFDAILAGKGPKEAP